MASPLSLLSFSSTKTTSLSKLMFSFDISIYFTWFAINIWIPERFSLFWQIFQFEKRHLSLVKYIRIRIIQSSLFEWKMDFLDWKMIWIEDIDDDNKMLTRFPRLQSRILQLPLAKQKEKTSIVTWKTEKRANESHVYHVDSHRRSSAISSCLFLSPPPPQFFVYSL